MSTEFAGKPIKIGEAEKYVKAYLPLKDCLKNQMIPHVNLSTVQVPNDVIDETKKHFNSTANAFVFSKELVMRFFPDDPSKPQADYLMVIFAAKYEGADKGEPTVVVAGVNKTANNKFVSLDIPEPGTEQPPKSTIINFPGPGRADGNIEFTIQ